MNKEVFFNIKQMYIFQVLFFSIFILSFILRVFFSKTLSLEDFGLIFAMINFFTIIAIFSNFGFSKSLRFFIPKFLANKEFGKIRNLFIYSFVLQMLLTIFFSVIIYILSGYLSKEYFHSDSSVIFIKYFLIYFFASNLLIISTDVLLAYKKNVFSQVFVFFQFFSILILSVLVFYLNLGNLVLKYALIWVIVTLLMSIISFGYLIFTESHLYLGEVYFDKKLFSDFFKMSFFSFFSDFSILILFNMDLILITYFLSLQDFAYYSNVLSIITVFASIFSSISIIFIPYISEYFEKQEFDKIRKIIDFIYNLILFFILPLSLVIYLFPEKILELLYGQDYMKASNVLSFLLFFIIFRILIKYNINLLTGLGLLKNLSILILPIIFLNLVLTILFIKKYGILGIALINALCWVLFTIITFFIISKKIGYIPNYNKLLKIFILNILFLMMLIFLKSYLIIFSNIYLNMSIVFLISFLIYFYLGNLVGIYTYKDISLFVYSSKIKLILDKYHNKYFKFFR